MVNHVIVQLTIMFSKDRVLFHYFFRGLLLKDVLRTFIKLPKSLVLFKNFQNSAIYLIHFVLILIHPSEIFHFRVS